MRSLGDIPHRLQTQDDRLLVLVLATSAHRRDQLRDCVTQEAPDCHVQMVDSYLDAMAQAPYLPMHLLILDMSMDNLLVPAFERFLSRAAPQARLHVFDDALDPPYSPVHAAAGLAEPLSLVSLRSAVRGFASVLREQRAG